MQCEWDKLSSLPLRLFSYSCMFNTSLNSDDNQRSFMINQIFIILTSKFSSQRHVCDWLMYLLGKIQSVLTTEDTFGKMSKAPFLLDIFFLSIVVSSGLSIFSNSAPPLRAHTIELFPEALEAISKRKHWSDNIVRVSLVYTQTTCNN